LTESYVPYMDQYNNAVSAFGVIVIILSAFNLSLSAHSKTPDPDLQQAAYGFALFAMVLCAALIGLFIVSLLGGRESRRLATLRTILGSPHGRNYQHDPYPQCLVFNVFIEEVYSYNLYTNAVGK